MGQLPLRDSDTGRSIEDADEGGCAAQQSGQHTSALPYPTPLVCVLFDKLSSTRFGFIKDVALSLSV